MSESNGNEHGLKRLRSPNYPAMSLVEAVQQIEKLSGKMGKHAAPREALATSMGYSGLHGASATAISALGKYGLLERVGEDYKLSELAMKIIAPHDLGEKVHALHEASQQPSLFATMVDDFKGDVPSDDILRPYLIRKGFAQAAVTAVIAAYRETMELVERENARYLEGAKDAGSSRGGPSAQPVDPFGGSFDKKSAFLAMPLPNLGVKLMEGERIVFTHEIEPSHGVRILASGDVDESLLDALEVFVELQKKRLERQREAVPRSVNEPLRAEYDK